MRRKGKGKAGRERQKRRVWASAPPEMVQLSGGRVHLDPQGVRVDMTQVDRDKSGRGDKGGKTLLMQPEKNQWRIVQEDWSALPANAEGR